MDEAYEKVMAMAEGQVPGELEDRALYHFYPGLERVREWLGEVGFTIEAEEMGNQ